MHKKTTYAHLCSANKPATWGINFDKCTVPLESSNSVAEIISLISCSLGTHPKNLNMVPISRTSAVLLPWWSKIKNASAIFRSKSFVISTERKNKIIYFNLPRHLSFQTLQRKTITYQEYRKVHPFIQEIFNNKKLKQTNEITSIILIEKNTTFGKKLF